MLKLWFDKMIQGVSYHIWQAQIAKCWTNSFYWFILVKKMSIGGMSCPRHLHSLSGLLLYKVYIRYYMKWYNTFFWLRYCLSSSGWHKANIHNIFCTLIRSNAEVFTSDIIRSMLPGNPVLQLLYTLLWFMSLFTGKPNPKISKTPSEVRGLWIKSVFHLLCSSQVKTDRVTSLVLKECFISWGSDFDLILFSKML